MRCSKLGCSLNSRHGSRLILRGQDTEQVSILLRDLERQENRSVQTPSGAGHFPISPDGSRLLYPAGRRLCRKLMSGGPAVAVYNTIETRGTARGEDSLIVLFMQQPWDALPGHNRCE